LKEKILIVEDNDMNRILLRAILLPYGFEVIEAVNGQEGVAVARERLPDLIVMDLQMPVMNGIDAMRVLKKRSSDARDPRHRRHRFCHGWGSGGHHGGRLRWLHCQTVQCQ
jgi:CheY-like chemotaxis protein